MYYQSSFLAVIGLYITWNKYSAYSQHYIYEIHPWSCDMMFQISSILSPFFPWKLLLPDSIWNPQRDQTFWLITPPLITFCKLTYRTSFKCLGLFKQQLLLTQAQMLSKMAYSTVNAKANDRIYWQHLHKMTFLPKLENNNMPSESGQLPCNLA